MNGIGDRLSDGNDHFCGNLAMASALIEAYAPTAFEADCNDAPIKTH